MKDRRLPVAVSFAFAVLLTFCVFAAVSEACERTPNAQERMALRVEQNLRAPLIQGVATDSTGRFVVFSACEPEEFECDLIAVNMAERTQRILRRSSRYGYTHPAISPDGSRVAAVRSPRNARPGQRDVAQDAVTIDPIGGEDQIVASAGDGRFDRIVYTGPDALLLVRSYRSTPAVRCLGDYCTDYAEVLSIANGVVARLSLDIAADGALGGGRTHILQLWSGGPIILRGSSREATVRNGLTFRRGSIWAFDPRTSTLTGPAANLMQMTELLDDSRREDGSLGVWTKEQFLPGQATPAQDAPFCGTLAEDASTLQTIVSAGRHAVFVVKLRSGNAVSLQVSTLEHQDDGQWREVEQVRFPYPVQ